LFLDSHFTRNQAINVVKNKSVHFKGAIKVIEMVEMSLVHIIQSLLKVNKN